MKPHSLSALIAAPLATLFAFTFPARAGEAGNARLVPGSADVIHDVFGIAIGMSCKEAAEKAAQISADHGIFPTSRTVAEIRLDNAKVSYAYIWNEVPLSIAASTVIDRVRFECIEGSDQAGVYKIERDLTLGKKGEALPAVSSMRELFQKKYGAPTVEYSPTILTTLFNRRGAIRSSENDCVQFGHGHLYEQSFVPFNADKCSYELNFIATEDGQKPGYVRQIHVFVEDYLRLENAIRAQVRVRERNQPKPDITL